MYVSLLNHVAHGENSDIINETDCLTCPTTAQDGQIYHSIIDGTTLQYRSGEWVDTGGSSFFEYNGKTYVDIKPIGESGGLELINPARILKVPVLLKEGYSLIKGGNFLRKIADFFASEHTSNKRPSNWNKHTKPRAGRDNTKNRQQPKWKQNPNKKK